MNTLHFTGTQGEYLYRMINHRCVFVCVCGVGGRVQMSLFLHKTSSLVEKERNTSGTRIGLGFRDNDCPKKQKKCRKIIFINKNKNIYDFDIPSSYVKICGETKFQLLEYSRSG